MIQRLSSTQRRRTWRYVSVRPDVRAGEPVVRGTRVPVHLLADLVNQGASREGLLEDYPAVSAQALDAALHYARLHPERGPSQPPPWRGTSPVLEMDANGVVRRDPPLRI